MKKILIVFILLFSSLLQAQYTQIPDPFFEGYLVNIGIDTDGEVNGQVLTSDIADVTQLTFDVNIFITDLTGIEDFESLEYLFINQMGITDINLSQNTNLYSLSIGDVSLESLDLSANINLTQIDIILHPDAGMFTSSITSLDLSNNILLSNLVLYYTLISELDLTSNINLDHLILGFMDELTVVNLKNGLNNELSFLEILDNPKLECLQVDDPQAVIEGVVPPYDSWFIENNPLLTITDDCNLGIGNITLKNQIKLYPNPVQNILYLENNSGYAINTLKVYDVLGRLVLQKNKQIKQLDISSLASGLLFVHMDTDGGVLIKKVLKE